MWKHFISFLKSDFNRKVGIIYWPALTSWAIWYFFEGVNPGFFDQHYVLVLFLAMAIIGFCLLATWNTYTLRFDLNISDRFAMAFGIMVMITVMLVVFGFPALVLWHHSKKKSALFEKEGVFVMADILGHRLLDLRKTDLSNLTVGFYDEGKKYRKVKLDMDAEQVKYVIGKSNIPLVYVKSYPEIAFVALNRNTLRKYAKVDIHELELETIIRLFRLSHLIPGEKLDSLKSMDRFWDHARYNNFRHAITEEFIAIGEDEITYVAPFGVSDTFFNLLKDEQRFTKSVDQSGHVEYRNDSLIVNIRRETSMNDIDKPDWHLRVNGKRITIRKIISDKKTSQRRKRS